MSPVAVGSTVIETSVTRTIAVESGPEGGDGEVGVVGDDEPPPPHATVAATSTSTARFFMVDPS